MVSTAAACFERDAEAADQPRLQVVAAADALADADGQRGGDALRDHVDQAGKFGTAWWLATTRVPSCAISSAMKENRLTSTKR